MRRLNNTQCLLPLFQEELNLPYSLSSRLFHVSGIYDLIAINNKRKINDKKYRIYELIPFKVWLILTGKIDYPWAPNWYQFKDWNGNTIYVPATACFSLIFSILAMIKAVIHFNITGVHVGVGTTIKYLTTKSLLIYTIPNFLSANHCT